jgi:hypothetical protein
MTLLTGWPTLTDDSGAGTDGTVLDESVFDAMKAAVEAVTHSTNNTTIDPNDITDEVVTARGNMTDLEDRLDGVIDSDGNLITPASIVSASQLQSAIGRVNLVQNDTMLLWSGGDAAAPDYYTFVDGGSATLARAGSGQGDTTRKIGLYCLSITNAAEVYQELISTTAYAAFDGFETEDISLGCWVWSSVATHARIQIDDGNSTSSSSYHTGGSAWEWLTVEHTLSAAGTYLRVQADVVSNGTAYFSAMTAMLGDYAPDNWVPSPKSYGWVAFTIPSSPSTGDEKHSITFSRPGLIKAVQAHVKTAPSFTITAGSNDDIDITEGISGDAIATIAAGDYATGAALAAAVATAINAAATDNTWTCTFSSTTGKFTIGHDAVQTGGLEWNTGPSTATSAADELGYNTDADDTGASSYVGDTDTRTETGFDVDIEMGDGASWNSIFASVPTLVGRGQLYGGIEPGGTYQYLCIPGNGFSQAADSDNTLVDASNSTMRVNYDAVPNDMADGYIQVRILQWLNPLEDFLAHDDF